ncbi:MAG: RNA polymerase sigma factor [Anaerolineae bacterium]|nr:RNA polymerase sigma factor [Anaerolineae bacterium]
MADSMRFETLIQEYHDEIFRYLWRLTAGGGGAVADADDLTQEVFMRAYRAFPRLHAGSNHRAWLYKIATNCANTSFKQRGREAARTAILPDDLPDSARSPEQHAQQHETLATILAALDDLPAKQRAAVILRHLQGLDYPAIAEALDCSEESARANVSHGIRRLRGDLAGTV